jgi:hypothetical protein
MRRPKQELIIRQLAQASNTSAGVPAVIFINRVAEKQAVAANAEEEESPAKTIQETVSGHGGGRL